MADVNYAVKKGSWFLLLFYKHDIHHFSFVQHKCIFLIV